MYLQYNKEILKSAFYMLQMSTCRIVRCCFWLGVSWYMFLSMEALE